MALLGKSTVEIMVFKFLPPNSNSECPDVSTVFSAGNSGILTGHGNSSHLVWTTQLVCAVFEPDFAVNFDFKALYI